MGGNDLLIVAGEASGDLHGARMLAELRRIAPGVRAFGLGGDELQGAGLDPVAHSSEISVVGITEALKILRRARRIFHELLAEVDRRGARTAVLIDSPDFNLRLAKKLHARGVRVIYYISPQVWAWRRRRVHLIRRVVDKMLVVFPFEAEFYRDHQVDAAFVGHPLIDEVPRLPQVWDDTPEEPESFRVALMPGSRNSEIDRILPFLLESAERLAGESPVPVRFSLIRAPTIAPWKLKAPLEAAGVEVEVVSGDRFEAIASCHLALCAAGTATVEVGLVGTPMVVVYKVSAWTYVLAKMLAHAPYAAMINVLLGREAVPELIQDQTEPEIISGRAVELLTDRGRIGEMRESLAQLREVLGEPGASRRAAAEVARLLPT
ncbi:MAG: lipid-A-disaccharide synthase [bacterium]|nr:lipid-A-disaccharide synthase [bacterium]